jgi:hypothetical protein
MLSVKPGKPSENTPVALFSVLESGFAGVTEAFEVDSPSCVLLEVSSPDVSSEVGGGVLLEVSSPDVSSDVAGGVLLEPSSPSSALAESGSTGASAFDTLIITCAVLLSATPSLALNVNLSCPVKPSLEV